MSTTMLLVLVIAAAAVSVSAQQFQRPSHCELDREIGPCKGKFVRYGFDRATGECGEFVYGGCQGNDNKFQTMESCRQECLGVSSRDNNANLRSSLDGAGIAEPEGGNKAGKSAFVNCALVVLSIAIGWIIVN